MGDAEHVEGLYGVEEKQLSKGTAATYARHEEGCKSLSTKDLRLTWDLLTCLERGMKVINAVC